MKKIYFSSLIISLLFLGSCKKKTSTDYLPGTWNVSSINVVIYDSSNTTYSNTIPSTEYIQSNLKSMQGSSGTGSSVEATYYKYTSSLNDTKTENELNYNGQLVINTDGSFSYTYSNQKTREKVYQSGVLQSTKVISELPSVLTGNGVWEWGSTQKSNTVLKLKDFNLGTAFGQPFDVFTIKSISENLLELSFENNSTNIGKPDSTTSSFQIKKSSTYIKLTK
jgi:hypothetical protein